MEDKLLDFTMAEGEKIERGCFSFYRSFAEALDGLEDSSQLALYRAIAWYGLDGKEPDLTGIEKTIWVLIRPLLEANWRKYGNSLKKQNGTKTEAKRKQNGTKTEAKRKQNGTKAEPNINININKDKDKDINKKDNININPFYGEILNSYSSDFQNAIIEWIEYKQGKGEPLAEIEIKKAVEMLDGWTGGDAAKARECVNTSIANGYKGLVKPTQAKTTPVGIKQKQHSLKELEESELKLW